MRDPISLGLLTVTVAGTEKVAPGLRAPVSSLAPQPGNQVIAVFVNWSGLGAFERRDRKQFVETFLEDRLALVDAAGARYKARHVMPRWLYYGHMASGSLPHDWVVAFHVPEESHTFTLYVQNPDPQEGYPRLAAIGLDR